MEAPVHAKVCARQRQVGCRAETLLQWRAEPNIRPLAVRGHVWFYSLNTEELCGIKMHLSAWIPLPTRGGSLTYRRLEMSDMCETRLNESDHSRADVFDQNENSPNYS